MKVVKVVNNTTAVKNIRIITGNGVVTVRIILFNVSVEVTYTSDEEDNVLVSWKGTFPSKTVVRVTSTNTGI